MASVIGWIAGAVFLVALPGRRLFRAGDAADRGKGRAAGAAVRQVRRHRRQPHPLCRDGRGAADRLRPRAGRAAASFPPSDVSDAARLPADRARPAGLGLFGARGRRDGAAARAGRSDRRLHRGAGAGEAAAGRPFARRRGGAGRRAQPSRCDLRHRGARAADAYGRRDHGPSSKASTSPRGSSAG